MNCQQLSRGARAVSVLPVTATQLESLPLSPQTPGVMERLNTPGVMKRLEHHKSPSNVVPNGAVPIAFH